MTTRLNVREFAYGSPEYEASLGLRRRFLREPLGLELTAQDTEGERSQRHFGLFLPGEQSEFLAGSLIAAPAAGGEGPATGNAVRLRQVVLDLDQRGKGLGRTLVLGAERLLHDSGCRECLLYARIEATGFYRACGYTQTGEVVELIGMPHHGMQKQLS